MNGVVGFLENRQRAKVALTHARHCLWILGNEATLTKSCTIWKELVIDAKKRGCFYNADVDKILAQAITVALVEHNKIHILLYMDSFLFREAKWKVSFSNDFLKSTLRVKNAETCKQVLTLLENLASGWGQSHRKKNFFPIIRTVQGQWVAESCLDCKHPQGKFILHSNFEGLGYFVII